MKIFKRDKRTNIEKEVDSALDCIKNMDPWTEEYTKAVNNIETLSKAKSSKNKMSKDTLITVGGSLAGILLILNHERLNVITTKALSFVIRGRV